MAAEKMWYYEHESGQRGPVPESQLKSMLADQTLPRDALVWADGLQGWTSASELPDLKIVAAPAQPPPRPKQAPATARQRPEQQMAEESQPATQQFSNNYFEQVKQILLHPKKFFQSMPKTGGTGNALLFLTLSLLVNAAANGLITMNMPIAVTLLILYPLSITIGGMFVNFVAVAMGGSGSYSSTLKVYCYSSVILLLSWIPIVGLVASFYSWYLFYQGFKRVHELDFAKTFVVLLISGLIGLAVLCLGTFGGGLIAFAPVLK